MLYKALTVSSELYKSIGAEEMVLETCDRLMSFREMAPTVSAKPKASGNSVLEKDQHELKMTLSKNFMMGSTFRNEDEMCSDPEELNDLRRSLPYVNLDLF